MKILIGLTLLIVSVTVNAECTVPKHVEYLPVGVLMEVCFKHEIKSAKYSRGKYIEIQIEKPESIPDEYTSRGIKGVVNFIAKKPGVVANAFIDTSDGKRVEFTFITTTSEVE